MPHIVFARRVTSAPHATGTLIALALATLLTGCRLVNMDPLEIVEWSPEERRVENPGKIDAVVLRFSSTPDRPRTESAFSLTADDAPLTGRFAWDKSTMRFVPDSPVENGRDYRIAVTGEAQDVYGNALARDFEHSFTTRHSDIRPTIREVTPSDGEVIPVEGATIRFEFSEPVDRASFYEAVDISPSLVVSVFWQEDDEVATVHPMETLTQQQEYTLRLDTRLSDLHGNALSEQFEMRLRAELEGPDPALVAVRASHEPAPEAWLADHTDEAVTLPHHPAADGEPSIAPAAGWERFWGFELEFNTPVRRSDVLAAIEFDPEIAFSLVPEFYSTSDSFEILPDERLEFSRDHTLRIAGDIRSDLGVEKRFDRFARFRVDGEASRPPEVRSVFFLEDPQVQHIAGPMVDDDELDLSEYADGEHLGFFDLYVAPAAGARFDPFELADGFSFAVENIAADIELINVVATEVGAQGALNPAPESAPAGDEQIIRIYAAIEDLENSGLVTLSIDGSVTDTYGNEFEQTWQLRLNQVSSQ